MIGLVHLVWAPLGPEPLRSFLRSYNAHPAGVEHELTIVLNGTSARADTAPSLDAGQDAGARGGATGGADAAREALLGELAGTEHRLLELEHQLLDLPAYGTAAQALQQPRLCFLNSYSVILADEWLAKLARALDEPGVGLVGASASWESQAEWVRGRTLYWPYQLALLRRARQDYPRFPNPHVRTTGFMLERDTLLGMGLQAAHDKRATYLLESGRHSITRLIQARGERAVVVGRDGVAYGERDWPASRTFRAGAQQNLLIADNRTHDWETAPARLRRRLSRDAWGDRA
jgi:hypothetical protein